MAHDVFVCHSSDDKVTADAVVATLEQQAIRCWVAPRDIPPGHDWAEAIVEAINASSVMVLVFSSNSNGSPHVIREIERAVSGGVPILPLRIEDVAPSASMEYFISGTHWLDALTPPLQRHLELLARSVRALLDAPGGGPESRTAARPPTTAPVMLELGPPRVAGPFGGRFAATSHDLTLRNGGDESVELQLDADDDGGHCSFTLPGTVTVPPHGVTTVAIKVRPRERRWRGNREIRWFSVMASSGDGGQPPAIVSGQFEDLPYGWVPYGVGAALGVPAAAVLAAVLLTGGGGSSEPDPSPQVGAPTTVPASQDSPGSAGATPSPTPATQDSPGAAPTTPVEDTAEPSMSVETATALLDRAVAAKDLSNQGQVEALEALLARDWGFEGADLSGIRLAGANLAGAAFGGAALAGTDLSGSDALEADFTGADLRFTNLNGTDLNGAILADAVLSFTDAESTQFTNVQAAYASFYGANLRGADFRNADLRGVVFTMADLTGARLDGANLEDTLFYGTLLEDVTFEGATFANTEITRSALSESALTPEQAGETCSTDPSSMTVYIDIALIEEIPNSQFSGSIEYSDLMTYTDLYFLTPSSTSSRASCTSRSEKHRGIWSVNGTELVALDFGAGYDTALLSKVGRRITWVRRIEDHMEMVTAIVNASQDK